MMRTDLFSILVSSMIISACSHKTAGVVAVKDTPARFSSAVLPQQTSPARKGARPPHLIYKMTGDYAALVPITLDGNGNLQSYPDPIDITESQRPVALGGGWYLDRRGINAGTAFLDYTYEQYHALHKVPTHAELMAHIAAKQGISAIWSCGTTSRSVEEYRELVAGGFPGCDCILPETPKQR